MSFSLLRFLSVRLLVPAALLLMATAGFVPSSAPAERTAGGDARPGAFGETVRADTIRVSARAGQPLIASLPDRLRGAEATYRALRAPALSWLVDRSFFYQTQPGERGDLPVLFERSVGGAVADTLVLIVSIGD